MCIRDRSRGAFRAAFSRRCRLRQRNGPARAPEALLGVVRVGGAPPGILMIVNAVIVAVVI
eukprot:1116026-Alexandrium_andersonii.AAC.1